MKQWNVVVRRHAGRQEKTVVSAKDYFAAKRIAAAMFNCKESEVQTVTEIR